MEDNITRLFFSYSRTNSKALIHRRQNKQTIKSMFGNFSIAQDLSTYLTTEKFKSEFLPSLNALGIATFYNQLLVVTYQPNDRDSKRVYNLVTPDPKDPLKYSCEQLLWKGLEEGVWLLNKGLELKLPDCANVLVSENEIIFKHDATSQVKNKVILTHAGNRGITSKSSMWSSNPLYEVDFGLINFTSPRLITILSNRIFFLSTDSTLCFISPRSNNVLCPLSHEFTVDSYFELPSTRYRPSIYDNKSSLYGIHCEEVNISINDMLIFTSDPTTAIVLFCNWFPYKSREKYKNMIKEFNKYWASNNYYYFDPPESIEVPIVDEFNNVVDKYFGVTYVQLKAGVKILLRVCYDQDTGTNSLSFYDDTKLRNAIILMPNNYTVGPIVQGQPLKEPVYKLCPLQRISLLTLDTSSPSTPVTHGETLKHPYAGIQLFGLCDAHNLFIIYCIPTQHTQSGVLSNYSLRNGSDGEVYGMIYNEYRHMLTIYGWNTIDTVRLIF